ncbi:hypothetical protein AMTRI_Chr03g143490 [Amborella trichopoda]
MAGLSTASNPSQTQSLSLPIPYLFLAPSLSLNQKYRNRSHSPFMFSLCSSHTQSLCLSIFLPIFQKLQQGSPTKLSSPSLFLTLGNQSRSHAREEVHATSNANSHNSNQDNLEMQ